MTLKIVMLGASGAVGQQLVAALCAKPGWQQLTLLNRRALPDSSDTRVQQQLIDPLDPQSYARWLPGHQAAVCTLGVGQPSAVSEAEFVRVDRDAVIAFAKVCKSAGVQHFELLSAVGADSASRSLYLRTKGELCDGLQALGFDRLSLFQPSMILTPTNRYGLMQGAMLAVWPSLNPVLAGPLRKYRGVRVEQLGEAMAGQLLKPAQGVQRLTWDQFSAPMA
jgi:uncharacterized protein YbjT (DUF2867 family)